MTTNVYVNTYTHSVAFVTDKMLGSMRRTIIWCGLNPEKMNRDWEVLERGVKAWIGTKDLLKLELEVFHETTGNFVGGWEFELLYSTGPTDDGAFWLDTDTIKNAIQKQGLNPDRCSYEIIVTTKANRPDVPGWNRTTSRPRDGFTRYSIGTAIAAGALSAGVSYWRKNQ